MNFQLNLIPKQNIYSYSVQTQPFVFWYEPSLCRLMSADVSKLKKTYIFSLTPSAI